MARIRQPKNKQQRAGAYVTVVQPVSRTFCHPSNMFPENWFAVRSTCNKVYRMKYCMVRFRTHCRVGLGGGTLVDLL